MSRAESPIPESGGAPAESVPTDTWKVRTLIKTLRAVANHPLPAMDVEASNEAPASTAARSPLRLRELASLVVPLLGNDGPIMSFDAALRSQQREYNYVAFKATPPGVHKFLGMGPRVLVQNLIQSKMSVISEVIGPLRDLLGSCPPQERMSLIKEAVYAGVPLGQLREVMGLNTIVHPDVWQLENIALFSPTLIRHIAEGMPLERLNEVHGPFVSTYAENQLQRLFCITRAGPELRKGRSCEQVLAEWGGDIFAEPAELRWVALSDDAPALQVHERTHSLQADDDGPEFGRQWLAAYGEAGRSAWTGVAVGEVVERYGLTRPLFRCVVEVASVYGAAGRDVYLGKCEVSEAIGRYQITIAEPVSVLFRLWGIGRVRHQRDRELAQLDDGQAKARQDLVNHYDRLMQQVCERMAHILDG